MKMLALPVAWVNGLPLASAASSSAPPLAIVVLGLFIGAVILSWVIR
jgi:hypothetical protein